MIIMSSNGSSNLFFVSSQQQQQQGQEAQDHPQDRYTRSGEGLDFTYNMFGKLGGGQFLESIREVLNSLESAMLRDDNAKSAAELLQQEAEENKGDDIRLKNVSESQINAGGGNDSITGLNVSRSQINADDGDDKIAIANLSESQVNAGNGSDDIKLQNVSRSQVNAGSGDDSIDIANVDSSQINAGSGNDRITLSNITDSQINAGDGSDVITISNASRVQVNAGGGSNSIYLDNVLHSQINLDGDANYVELTDIASAQVNGSGGSDVIKATNTGKGSDYMQISTGDGNDLVELTGQYNAYINTGSGNDMIILDSLESGTISNVNYERGDGNDVISLGSTRTNINMSGISKNDVNIFQNINEETGKMETMVSLKDGSGGITILSDKDASGRFGEIRFSDGNWTAPEKRAVESGTDGDDLLNTVKIIPFGKTLTVTENTDVRGVPRGGGDYLDGGGGNDTIIGRGTLIGGADNDNLQGSGMLYGGSGNDIISGYGYIDGGSGNDYIEGTGTIRGGNGNDVIIGTGDITGGTGDDFIRFEKTLREVLYGEPLNYQVNYSKGDGSDTVDIMSENVTLNMRGISMNDVDIEKYFNSDTGHDEMRVSMKDGSGGVTFVSNNELDDVYDNSEIIRQKMEAFVGVEVQPVNSLRFTPDRIVFSDGMIDFRA